MPSQKEFMAFISYATPDFELAEALSELFAQMGEYVYFAPENLPASGTPEWREEIVKAIKKSRCFIPIYSKHSLRRPWVLYETGVADANKLPPFPGRVSAVSIDELIGSPFRDVNIYNLSDLNDLTNLVINVIARKRKMEKSKLSAIINRKIHSEFSIAQRVIALAKSRLVFLAGNIPRKCNKITTKYRGFTSSYEKNLKEFAARLSCELFDNDFALSSCPQVSCVGRVAAQNAVKKLSRGKKTNQIDFRIGGIYPIDLETRKIRLSRDADKTWQKLLFNFRKSYLSDTEWLIVVGGSDGTRDEFAAAIDLTGIKIFAMPCFGGVGKWIFKRQPPGYKDICSKCRGREGSCGEKGIKSIVKFIKEH